VAGATDYRPADRGSNLGLFCHLERIVDFDAEVSHCTFAPNYVPWRTTLTGQHQPAVRSAGHRRGLQALQERQLFLTARTLDA
jgi:hypothetical protein